MVEVRVVDDGVGFDPVHTLFESGIAAMRSFAGAVDGRVTIDSARGAGTSVRATLGPPAGAASAAVAVEADPEPAPGPQPQAQPAAPHLRLVRDPE